MGPIRPAPIADEPHPRAVAGRTLQGVQQTTGRRWRPFWIHQGAEYLVGLVMVAAGVQSPTPTFPVLAGGLIVLNAAVVIGPIGAFRLVGRPLHRLLDLAVIAVVVVVAALPFIDIDSASRLTMVVLVGVMAFVWLSTNFGQPPSRADPRGATFSRRGTMVAPAQPRPAGATRDSRRRPMRSRVDAETIGRTAGRLVGRASEYARRRRERR